MIKKIGSILGKHKYAISIFLFFLVYDFVIVGEFSFPKINNLTYTFHLVDYSIGFCPTLLPGAIYNALFPTTRAEVVNLYLLILYHVFLLAVSFMLEKFLYRFDSKNRFIAFIIVLFFITGPATFSVHLHQFVMLDTYWLFLAVAFLLMVQNKYLKWFIPIIFVLSIFIHLGALISFVPFFALIVLLEASRNEKVSKSYVFIFAISVFLAATAFVYFTAFEEKNLTLSLYSFRSLIHHRNISEWDDLPLYYDYSLYKIIPDSYGIEIENFASADSSFITRIFGTVLAQIKGILRNYPPINSVFYQKSLNVIIVSIPVIGFLYKYVLSVFKKEKENKLRRFVWFCTLCLLPFTFLTSVFVSNDTIRFFGHGVMCLFTLVMYELYRSSDNAYLETLNNRFNNSSYFAVIIYFVFYMTCTVNPYA